MRKLLRQVLWLALLLLQDQPVPIVRVRLKDGRVRQIEVPEGLSVVEAKAALIDRRHPFDGEWVQLNDGTAVRIGEIGEVMHSTDDPLS